MENSDVPLKTFPWEQYAGTPVARLARLVVEWGKLALWDNQFDRGDYKYSIKLMLQFFGVVLPNLSFKRPKDTSPARFLIYGVFYLEITTTMNHPLLYELYIGRESKEILIMAMFSANYYLPNMIKAKYPSTIPTLTTALVDELRQLREVHTEMANCALEVVGRHLEPVSGELVILGIADTSLTDLEREQMGKKLWSLRDTWVPGQMGIQPAGVPDLVNDERYWEVIVNVKASYQIYFLLCAFFLLLLFSKKNPMPCQAIILASEYKFLDIQKTSLLGIYTNSKIICPIHQKILK